MKVLLALIATVRTLSTFATQSLLTQPSNSPSNEAGNGNQYGSAAILFAGDISLDKPVRKGNGSSCTYDGILANLTEYFMGVDYNLVNLEAPFVSREIATQTFLHDKGIHNMAWPEGVQALTKAGIISVSLANNHITDFGAEGLAYTEMVLQANSIESVGVTVGNTPPYSNQVPLIKTLRGIKFGILSYCADTAAECKYYRPYVNKGPALLYRETAEVDIKELKKKVDIVIVCLHWGSEYMSIPGEEQRQLAVYLSGIGVSLIIGTHPHITQGHEWINDTLVHYSLGNFVFHPHFTKMNTLQGVKDRGAIHTRMMQQGKLSRGPSSFTELFKVEFTKSGIKDAYYLPVRIHMDIGSGCPYPKSRRNDWLKVCGPEDDNCYVPRHDAPVYLDVYEDENTE